MKLGVFCLLPQREQATPPEQVFAQTVEQVQLAEAIGLDIAWFAEHHFSNYCLCVSPLVMAAYVAPITKRIRLGSGVVVLPLYDPVRLIEEVATVDVMSGGPAGAGHRQRLSAVRVRALRPDAGRLDRSVAGDPGDDGAGLRAGDLLLRGPVLPAAAHVAGAQARANSRRPRSTWRG